MVENVKKNLNQNVYKTIIPRNIRLAEAPSYGIPINLYDSKSVGAESYRLLAKEVVYNGTDVDIDELLDNDDKKEVKEKKKKLLRRKDKK